MIARRSITMIAILLTGMLARNVLAADTAQAKAQASPAFDVIELRVLGNTVLPAMDIENVLMPFLGSGKTLGDMETVRKTLEEFYHQRGYGTVYVDIPDQTVDEGIVRLKVTEGKLGRVEISGARYFSERQIKTAVPEARPGKVPSLPLLTNQVSQVNAQTPDRAVVPVLKAGSEPGTVDLMLKVDDHLPLHTTLEVNDFYTANTEPLRVNAQVTYDHLFARFDTLGINYQVSPQDTSQVRVWMGNYSTHLFDSDTRLVFVYVDSKSAVATLGAGDSSVNVLGTGKNASVRLIQPLSGNENNGASLGAINLQVDYKDYLQNICVGNQSAATCDSTGFSTPIHYFNLSAGYSGGWRHEGWQSTVNVTGNFGVRGARNNADEFDNKRFLGTPNYFYFKSDGLLLFKLPAQWNLQLHATAQYAFDPLVTNEQLSIAGSDGVRGYLESEELGDRGWKGGMQLGSPQWPVFNWPLKFDTFVFYDYGTARLVSPLPSDVASISLQSLGAGLNFNLLNHFNGTVFWVQVLDDGSQTKRSDNRVQFDVRAAW